MKIKIGNITLNWTCDDCSETVEQPLSDVAEVGTAICPECGRDMALKDEVTVDSKGATDPVAVA